MRALRHDEDDRVWFLLADVAPQHLPAIQALSYQATPWGYGRSFPRSTPDLDAAFARFAEAAPLIVRQKAGELPIPWDAALEALLVRTAGMSLGWMLTGSAALAARGAPLTPGDLDLVVEAESADGMEAVLADCIIEPAQPFMIGPGDAWMAERFVRGYLHTCIEWIAGVNHLARGDVGLDALHRAETIQWRGQTRRVPPLALQLEVNAARGRAERVQMIRSLLEERAAQE